MYFLQHSVFYFSDEELTLMHNKENAVNYWIKSAIFPTIFGLWPLTKSSVYMWPLDKFADLKWLILLNFFKWLNLITVSGLKRSNCDISQQKTRLMNTPNANTLSIVVSSFYPINHLTTHYIVTHWRGPRALRMETTALNHQTVCK